MASPARCVELQHALALLKGASDAEVKRVGGAYGVLRPLRQLRAALPDRLDLFQVEPTSLMASPARCLELQQAPALLQVAELPMEVVERMLPLLPACTLLRSRAVCR